MASAFGGIGWQFFDANGIVLSGGKIWSYSAGTTTPAPTYTDRTGTIPLSNPIILNAAGRVATGEIWQPAGSQYKYVLTTSSDVLLGTFDNVGVIAAGSALVQNFTGTGAQTVFTLTYAPIDENATNIYVSGIYQQKNTYSVSSTQITFSQAPPLNATIEVNYFT